MPLKEKLSRVWAAKPEKTPPKGGFARAGFPHKPEKLARHNRKRNVVERADFPAAPKRKVLGQPPGFQDRLTHPLHPP